MTLNTRVSMHSPAQITDMIRTPAASVGIRCLVLLAATLTGTAVGVTSAAEPAPDRSSVNAVEIDGAELFTREWIPGDRRSHGGDGLGPVFNDSSCVACHNQGGTGGAGSASKNVEIVTAFHAPANQNGQQNSLQRMTLPGILFQSVFGNLDNVSVQQRQRIAEQSKVIHAVEPPYS